MNFYPHHLGDYAKDTKDLSMLEHGAYRLLLDHNYATEQPVPTEMDKLYRIAGARTPAEMKAVQFVAEKFFPVNGDGRRHNKRAEAEIDRMQGKSKKARESAERRWGRTENADADGMRTHSGGNAIQEPISKDSTASAATAAEGRGDAAPACPHEKVIALYHEVLPNCVRVGKWTPARQQMLRARWREEAKPNREKHKGYRTEDEGLAYWRRVFSWCAESKFLTGQEPGREGKPPFVLSLPWLLKAENFAKCIEGNYHR